jgi:hypothetical protein
MKISEVVSDIDARLDITFWKNRVKILKYALSSFKAIEDFKGYEQATIRLRDASEMPDVFVTEFAKNNASSNDLLNIFILLRNQAIAKIESGI